MYIYTCTILHGSAWVQCLSIRLLILAAGTKFFGPKQYPFLALLPAEVWADIVVEEVGNKHPCNITASIIHCICAHTGLLAVTVYTLHIAHVHLYTLHVYTLYNIYSDSVN